ncbi:antitoxin Xre/MbcA/ParS toxin-binding domain-containing protein [Acidithiobacillus caldus]|nr:antitoxin Xre/MbcA/ParS toxin-binding domain-containing protein [Acidithiobacillus caldus]
MMDKSGVSCGSAYAGKAGEFRIFYLRSVASLAEEAQRGVQAGEIVRVGRAMGRPNDYVFRVLRFSPATAKRKLKKAERMSPEQSERVLGLERIIGLVEVMLEKSDVPSESFDAPVWVANWLDRPCPALGNKCPAEYMGTRMGQELVEGILAQMQSGAYA